ncbi:isoamylase early set domain-containing protein [Marinitoga sp. 1155]|uniref:isoamylase early set domain-containing protein n=1 Tax=Marinitoga sp. 1155 TaxID=1428448 RepID=UPI0006587507|nr:isoamylase early set domain-containing protein [Marinitoga sp. 1155]KLO23627.1 hypothetical protein X274_06090 [Marinitoga sp. 1155]
MKKVLLTVFLIILSIVSFSKVYVYKGVVVFEYKDLTASSVYLAGSFNNWDSTALQMKKIKGGIWRITLKLSPGDYQYKFVINGTDWKEDPEAPDYAPDGFGGKNGAFSLVLENGELKIKKATKQESGIINGSYVFDLKSKIDTDTYSLKTPTLSHVFNLKINPEKSGMKFEANLVADNSSWQFRLESLKVRWENNRFVFGLFNNSSANTLWKFYETNIEYNKTGFYGGIKLRVADVVVDIYSENNELKYFTTARVGFENTYIYLGYLPATDETTMNLYIRAETLNVGIEGKYSDSLEYLKADFINDNLYIEGIYTLVNKNIEFYSKITSLLEISGNYNISENTYFLIGGLNLPILENINILTDMYYDNSNNLGYKIGVEFINSNVLAELKIGHDFDMDFENYYLFISAKAEF